MNSNYRQLNDIAVFKIAKAYWKELIGEELKGSKLPVDVFRQQVMTNTRQQVSFKIMGERFNKLIDRCKGNDMAIYVILLATLHLLLTKYNDETESVIVTPIYKTGNTTKAYNNWVFFKNNSMQGSTVKELLARVKESVKNGFKNQIFPLEELFKELQLEGVSKALNVALAYLNIQDAADDIIAKNNDCIVFTFKRSESEVEGNVSYDGLYSAEMIESVIQQYEFILDQVLSSDVENIEEIYLDADMKYIEVKPSTGLHMETIKEEFEKIAETYSDKLAVVCDGKAYTYEMINKKANQLARALQERGFGTKQIGAIIVKPSIETIIGILGIIKSGGAYVPIDSEFPYERKVFITEDCKANILLVQDDTKYRDNIECIDLRDADNYMKESSNLESTISAEDLIYMIYTSGTTGNPKGVMIQNRNLINYVKWFKQEQSINHEDATVIVSSLAFDLSYTSLYSALLSGATVHLVSKNLYSIPKKLIGYMSEQGITYMKCTPSLYSIIVNSAEFEAHSKLEKVRLIVLGGEKINYLDIKRYHNHYENTVIMNHYGPTETTIGVIAHAIDFKQIERYREYSILGKSINGIQIIILNQDGHPLPKGAIGEICVIGEGLARGYWNNEQLTKEKFGEIQIGQRTQCLYHTGDIGRYINNEYIQFLGRRDSQIKFNGYRIELKEIENVLLNIQQINEAVVQLVPEKGLCAYIVYNQEISNEELVRLLQDTIPFYAIPNHFIALKEIPLTLNGKADYRKLAEIELQDGTEGVEYEAPRNEIEEMLVHIFEDILKVEPIGIQHNFFVLGGDSIKAIQIIAKLEEKGYKLTLSDLFSNQTIKQMSSFVNRRTEQVRVEEDLTMKNMQLTESEFSVFSTTHNMEEIEDIYPLAPMQEGMLFYWIMNQKDDAYSEQSIFELEGQVDKVLLEKSMIYLVEKNEILRTRFAYENMIKPHQIVYKKGNVNFNYVDITAEKDIEQVVNALRIEDRKKGFDLLNGNTFRMTLIKCGQDSYKILFNFHHILMDGWCIQTIVEELFIAYQALKHNEAIHLPVIKPYKNYIDWLVKRDQKTGDEYWKNYLSSIEQITELPFKREVPKGEYNSANYVHYFKHETTEALKQIASTNRCTAYNVFQAAWGVLLAKYNNSEDVVFGTVVSGRPAEITGIEKIIGLFINTVPVCIHMDKEMRFADLLKNLQDEFGEKEKHIYYPLAEIQNYSKLKNELISHILIYQNYPLNEKVIEMQKKGGLGFTFKGVEDFWKTNYDFNLMIEPGETLQFKIAYNTNAFEVTGIQKIMNHLENLICDVARQSDSKISEINILSEAEERHLIEEINQTEAVIKEEQNITELFKAMVQQQPDKIAIRCHDCALTYAELNKRANLVAKKLLEQGLSKNTLIAVIMERSCNVMVALLGILKAGGAYIPIDPKHPKDRIYYMLQNSHTNILVSTQEKASEVGFGGTVLDVSELLENELNNLTEEYNVASPNDLAYMIYTSGSTGNPKGVCIEHKALVNFTESMQQLIPFNAHTVIGCLTSISFDIFGLESIVSLALGFEVVMGDEKAQIDPKEIAHLIDTNHINTLQMTPSRMKLLLADTAASASLRNIELIIIGGEAVALELVKAIREKTSARIFNLYGPTETTIWSTMYELTNAETVLIGKPILNTQVYIVDDHHHLVPEGIIGELCIGGKGLARGYYDNQKLTDEKFIDNPFVKGTKMYKTGDLVRLETNGCMRYIERKDFQVKVRGFRIEMGEIEAVIKQVENIKEVVVLPVQENGGEVYLIAYYTAHDEVDNKVIREEIAKKLPNYMIPSYFRRIEKIPLNQNGKINRKALQEIEGEQAEERSIVFPTTEIETKLYNIWKEVLKLEKISIDDNFFEIGGHSLKALTVCITAQQQGMPLNIGDMYQYDTIRKSAKHIEELQGSQWEINSFDELIEVLNQVGLEGKYYLSQQGDKIFSTIVIRTEDKVALEQVINKKINPSSYPHYIRWTDSFEKEVALVPVHKLMQEEIENILDDIRRENTTNIEKLSKAVTVNQYPLSGIQTIQLKLPQQVSVQIELGKDVDETRIKAAIKHILNEQKLLRSVLVQKQVSTSYSWEEKENIGDFNIAVVDLTAIAPEQIDEIVSQAVHLTKVRMSQNEQYIPYEVILVKENLKENRLIFIFNHLIFDGYSKKVFKNRFLELYRGKDTLNDEIVDYSEYIKAIENGPIDISANNIIETFKLKEFMESIQMIQNRVSDFNLNQATHMQRRLELDKLSIKQEELFDTLFHIFAKAINEMLELKNIPLLLIHYGREYGDETYYNTLGEFIDYIPVIINKDSHHVEQQMLSYINKVKAHHINFAQMLVSQNTSEAYAFISQCIQQVLTGIICVFNFQYDQESYEDALEEKIDNAIIFNVKIGAKHIDIQIDLPFEYEQVLALETMIENELHDRK